MPGGDPRRRREDMQRPGGWCHGWNSSQLPFLLLGGGANHYTTVPPNIVSLNIPIFQYRP